MTAGIRLTRQEFIDRSIVIHGQLYDYSFVQYKNTHTKVKIICPIHGEFFQRPMDHVRGNKCYTCSGKQKTSQDSFIVRAQQAIGNNYDFSSAVYKNLDTAIEVRCLRHGMFTKLPRAILQQRQGCQQCGTDKLKQQGLQRRSTLQQFINAATLIHGNRYLYTSAVYVGTNKKVIIICLHHGPFSQTPARHTRGQGCPICNTGSGKGGYSYQYFEHNPSERDTPATLYLMDITNGNEHFYKLGITVKSIDQRFARTEYKGMKVIPVLQKQTTLYEAFHTEQQLLNDLKEYKFFPNTKFSGYTECVQRNAQVLSLLAPIFLD